MMPTACFLDFDHMLFHTDQFFHVEVREAFQQFGIDDRLWQEAYETVWPTGYTLGKHVEEVCRRTESPLSPEKMSGVLVASFSDLQRFIFWDVALFLDKTRQLGVILFLLSFGDKDWQLYKVRASGIASYFTEILLTETEGKKVAAIEKRAAMFKRIIVVDNNPTELDGIKDVMPDVETYCINRVPEALRFPKNEMAHRRFLEARRYLDKKWRHPHIACKTLAEVHLE